MLLMVDHGNAHLRLEKDAKILSSDVSNQLMLLVVDLGAATTVLDGEATMMYSCSSSVKSLNRGFSYRTRQT